MSLTWFARPGHNPDCPGPPPTNYASLRSARRRASEFSTRLAVEEVTLPMTMAGQSSLGIFQYAPIPPHFGWEQQTKRRRWTTWSWPDTVPSASSHTTTTTTTNAFPNLVLTPRSAQLGPGTASKEKSYVCEQKLPGLPRVGLVRGTIAVFVSRCRLRVGPSERCLHRLSSSGRRLQTRSITTVNHTILATQEGRRLRAYFRSLSQLLSQLVVLICRDWPRCTTLTVRHILRTMCIDAVVLDSIEGPPDDVLKVKFGVPPEKSTFKLDIL